MGLAFLSHTPVYTRLVSGGVFMLWGRAGALPGAAIKISAGCVSQNNIDWLRRSIACILRYT